MSREFSGEEQVLFSNSFLNREALNNFKVMRNLPCWYAINTKPGQEDRADSNLKAWQVETFNPRFRERRHNQYSGKVTHLIKPLFPQYIFARFNAYRMFNKVSYTRGVHAVVSFGGWPTPVDDEVIEMLRSRTAEDGLVRMEESLKPGDKVMVKGGAFKDLTGVFERGVSDIDRVSILLSCVSYQGRIIVDRDSVEKINGPKAILVDNSPKNDLRRGDLAQRLA